MKFGRWLNSLTFIDHVIILLFFSISFWLAHLTMNGFRKLVERTNQNPYAQEFRSSPLILSVIAIPYTIILYRIFGLFLTELLKSTF
ncbi:MAG: hypothetical protein CMF79_04705 [Candidatus Marinimicrobia bacterium]|jgi:uncharacterized membrane protein|nr:hypothetical protein [Candidatus Neomarinimicrobiota bacterium]